MLPECKYSLIKSSEDSLMLLYLNGNKICTFNVQKIRETQMIQTAKILLMTLNVKLVITTHQIHTKEQDQA